MSLAQYRAAVDKLNSGLAKTQEKVATLPSVAAKATDHWYYPDWLKDKIRWCAEKMASITNAVIEKLQELIVGILAPVEMFMAAYEWQGIRGKASGVQGQIDPKNLQNQLKASWKGKAADAYLNSMAAQHQAAGKIVTIGDKAAISLGASALAGLAFYVALGVIIYQLFAALGACVAALMSGVFSWAGALGVIAEAGVTTAMITAAVTTAVAVLGAQAATMVVLHGEASDNSVFPGGKWPSSGSDFYKDGTVKDGDADWSTATA